MLERHQPALLACYTAQTRQLQHLASSQFHAMVELDMRHSCRHPSRTAFTRTFRFPMTMCYSSDPNTSSSVVPHHTVCHLATHSVADHEKRPFRRQAIATLFELITPARETRSAPTIPHCPGHVCFIAPRVEAISQSHKDQHAPRVPRLHSIVGHGYTWSVKGSNLVHTNDCLTLYQCGRGPRSLMSSPLFSFPRLYSSANVS